MTSVSTAPHAVAVGPFPLRSISRLSAEQIHALEQFLFGLAPDYLAQKRAALQQDTDRSTFADFRDVRQYVQWQHDHPRASQVLAGQWQAALGIRETNNLRLWFNTDGGFLGAYNTADSRHAGAKYLRRLELNEPDFCWTALQAVQRADHLAQAVNLPKQIDHEAALALQVVADWIAELYMSDAYNRLLHYPGASEPQISALCR